MLVRVCEVSHHSGRRAGRAGFTLMELLVVVAILLVLISIATPIYFSQLERSSRDIARANATSLAGNLRQFALSHGGIYPEENTWHDLGLPPERTPPIDPWGRPYQWMLREIVTSDGNAFPDPVVWSGGPTGTELPEGELSSAR